MAADSTLSERGKVHVSGENDFNVFEYQQRMLPVLLGWAAGSVVAGLLWRQAEDDRLRGVGAQFVGWGLVDGLIAAFGLFGAKRSAEKLAHGEMARQEHDQQASRFETIVWVNAALDVGYIIGGWLHGSKDRADEQRQGTSLGIMVQGAFLFVWDIVLAGLLRVKRNAWP